MSWQLASFAIVLTSLAFGFWWWERSRPPSKLLAVVATLAALAALGRDAFAAVPDVKPITAIVLVAGLAFGARPGFAVGAIAGLSSNILLGEGPWTPWQMLGWGLVGLLGAGLGRLTKSREPHRLTLALACAGAAECFNLIVDLYTWTGTGNRSLAGFGLVLGQAFVFDLTHVIASFGFGFAFGPALLRMLVRVRMRLDVKWSSGLATGGLVLALLSLAGRPLIAPAPARADSTRASAAARSALAGELAYLARSQDRDGGFGAAAGQESSELYTAWAAIGMAAAGRDPLRVTRDGHSVLSAMRAEADSLEGAGDFERTILALHACGVPLKDFPGKSLVSRLLAFRERDGSFEDLSNLTAFGLLAMRAAGYPSSSGAVREAAAWLLRQQEPDGGFGYATKGGGSDVDDTAAVVQALVSAGRRSATGLSRAIGYIAGSQDADGGFPQERGGSSNAQSTSWAVQAFVAARRDPETVTHAGSRSPLGYLEGLTSASGSVRYSATGSQTPVWVTSQALTALARRPFPVAPVAAKAAAVSERPGTLAGLVALILAPARAFSRFWTL